MNAAAAEARIRKLLALAASARTIGSVHEAAAARLNAERIAAAAGLDLAEIESVVVIDVSAMLGGCDVPWTNEPAPCVPLYPTIIRMADGSFFEVAVTEEDDGAMVTHFTSETGEFDRTATTLHRGWWADIPGKEAFIIAADMWGVELA